MSIDDALIYTSMGNNISTLPSNIILNTGDSISLNDIMSQTTIKEDVVYLIHQIHLVHLIMYLCK